MASTGSRMSKMAKHRLRFTTPPESASSLHSREAREGETGCLARLAHLHMPVRSSNTRGHGRQHPCSIRAQGSCVWNRVKAYVKFAMGKRLGADAGVIAGVDPSRPCV